MLHGLSDLLDSDMEATNYVNENSLISTASDETQMASRKAAVVKRVKKRKCVTMPKRKPVVRPQLDALGEKQNKTAGRKRKAAEEEVPEEDSIMEVQSRADTRKHSSREDRDIQSKPRGRTKTKKPIVREEEEDDEDEEEEVIERVRSNFAPVKTSKSIPKPQSIVEPSLASKKAKTEVLELRKGHGAPDPTAKNDPELRRRLGEITRKCESIDLKYRNLKDVGIHEATSNVERMRKQCENITEASNRLVSSLKKELAAQAPMVAEARKHEKRAQNYEDEVNRLQVENKVATSQLTAAQNEIKALQTKLTALKASAAASTESKIPVPPVKAAPVQRALLTASGSDAVQTAQLKLDLYGDLTGLIVRSVKKTDEGDTYDCIQTGRNGSKYTHRTRHEPLLTFTALHFKLSIDAEEAKTSSFEDTEFIYTPLLDSNRDKDLIDIMPAYLTEDITFARANAAKFYQRVQETLTKKLEVVDEAR